MHDILFKNSTSLDHQRRDIFLSEAVVEDGIITKSQKHFVYFVREHLQLESQEKVVEWLNNYGHMKKPCLKSLNVFKSYNSKVGEERFEVKIVGNLHVLYECQVFNVDFIQIFKIVRKDRELQHSQ